MKSTASFVVTTFMSMWATSAFAVSAGAGTLVLTVNAPDEAMALIEIRSIQKPEQVKVVVHQSDDLIHEIDLDVGNYKVIAHPLYSEGVRYVPKTDPFVVRVKSKSKVNDDVTYIASKGVQNLRVTDITQSSVSLDWDAERGDDTFVRRVEGGEAAMSPSQGVNIPLTDSSLIDTDLKAGTTYTYSIFARPGDGAYGRSVHDPVTITVGTVPATVAVGVPTFVLNPRTKILKEGDYLAAAPTGTGVRLDLGPGANISPLGSFLTLPISESLKGGYVGEVVDVSDDGSTVWLVPAPLASAFDLYRLNASSFQNTTATVASAQTEESEAALALTGTAWDSSGEPAPSKEEIHRQYRGEGSLETPLTAEMDIYSSSLSQALTAVDIGSTGIVECKPDFGFNLADDIVDLKHSSYAAISINNYDIVVAEIPIGVYVDFGYEVDIHGTIDIETALGGTCYLDLPGYFQTFATGPVPVLVKAEPILGLEIDGLGGVARFEFKKTIGFETESNIALVGTSHDFRLINEEAEITNYDSSSFSAIQLKAGGSIEAGPGVGTKEAGILLGIGGEVFAANASLKTSGLCTELSFQSELNVYLTFEAWVPYFEPSATYEFYNDEWLWFDEPLLYPKGCSILNPGDPTDDVAGEGVVVVDSKLSGLSNQWDKVEGFVPGKKTWVLSTGDIKDVVGMPSYFASTDLGQPGNGELSNLSGYTTYDAVTYSMTVIPSGDTLHVRYVFASEEYPEYVGSPYNDVMAVFVNGENCAFVPGTNIPVAVNTINHLTNSQYYIDNQAGSSGYSTSMDGLTVPLTCSVPVTPGVPVTVKISIADASDPFFDSAIALLDGGIWSD